eukprot:scaffold1875_cov253-Pinguiococcus_pyrenoidosus.AAC.21
MHQQVFHGQPEERLHDAVLDHVGAEAAAGESHEGVGDGGLHSDGFAPRQSQQASHGAILQQAKVIGAVAGAGDHENLGNDQLVVILLQLPLKRAQGWDHPGVQQDVSGGRPRGQDVAEQLGGIQPGTEDAQRRRDALEHEGQEVGAQEIFHGVRQAREVGKRGDARGHRDGVLLVLRHLEDGKTTALPREVLSAFNTTAEVIHRGAGELGNQYVARCSSTDHDGGGHVRVFYGEDFAQVVERLDAEAASFGGHVALEHLGCQELGRRALRQLVGVDVTLAREIVYEAHARVRDTSRLEQRQPHQRKGHVEVLASQHLPRILPHHEVEQSAGQHALGSHIIHPQHRDDDEILDHATLQQSDDVRLLPGNRQRVAQRRGAPRLDLLGGVAAAAHHVGQAGRDSGGGAEQSSAPGEPRHVGQDATRQQNPLVLVALGQRDQGVHDAGGVERSEDGQVEHGGHAQRLDAALSRARQHQQTEQQRQGALVDEADAANLVPAETLEDGGAGHQRLFVLHRTGAVERRYHAGFEEARACRRHFRQVP